LLLVRASSLPGSSSNSHNNDRAKEEKALESTAERRARKAVEYQHDALEMMYRSKPGVGELGSPGGLYFLFPLAHLECNSVPASNCPEPTPVNRSDPFVLF